jgi:hypothetical protein
VQGGHTAAEALGQRQRPIGAAVGDEDRADALVGQRAGGQLARLAGADDDDARSARSPTTSRARSTATVETLVRLAPIRSRAHALAGLQRRAEEAVRQRAGRARGQRGS